MILIPELKRIREERSMSLQMIAEEADVLYSEIWHAEYSGTRVHPTAAELVAEVLGVGVEHLTGEKPAPPPPPDFPSWLTVLDPLVEEVAM